MFQNGSFPWKILQSLLEKEQSERDDLSGKSRVSNQYFNQEMLSQLLLLGVEQRSRLRSCKKQQCKSSLLTMGAHDQIKDKFWHSCLNKIRFFLTDFRIEKDSSFGSQNMNLWENEKTHVKLYLFNIYSYMK